MNVKIGPDLEAALNAAALQQGIAPEDLALNVLRERFLGLTPPIQPQDEWERLLISTASDCGVSLSNEAVSSDGLYDTDESLSNLVAHL